MSDQIAKQVNQTGTYISKEKLLEMIRKSQAKQFTYSQSQSNAKSIVVVVTP